MNINEILEYKLLEVNGYELKIFTIVGILFTIIISKFVLAMAIRIIRKASFVSNNVDYGRRYALEQFSKYLVYTIAFLMIVQSMGIDLSLIWAGSAALLVGIGLGLQQIFNDLASGVILLIEGEIEVGDVVLVDGTIGRIKKIAIRASHIETRDKVTMIVPNSRLIASNVSNYGAYLEDTSRFTLNVGIAYGSDVELVTKILLQVADEHQLVCKDPKPIIFFANFGESSLDFELHFFSKELLYIARVKSEMRYRIDALFRENNVQIPFPQRDIWLRNFEKQ